MVVPLDLSVVVLLGAFAAQLTFPLPWAAVVLLPVAVVVAVGFVVVEPLVPS